MVTYLKAIVCSILIQLGVDAPCGLNVDKVHTPLTQEEVAGALQEAHEDVFGCRPSPQRLAMAWAQVAFENGRGERVFNNNLGNIGSNPVKPRRPYYKLAGHRFRSFENPMAGAIAYWQTLKSRCSGSLKHFDAGDPFGAAVRLKNCGYYRTDIDHYTVNLTSLFYEANKHM